MSFAEQMKKAKKAADEGGAGEYTELEVGSYILQLTNAFRNVSKNGEGRNQTNFDCTVIEPAELAGETHRFYHNLDHNVGLSICIQDFAKMDIDISGCTELEQLDPYLEQIALLQPIFNVNLVKKKGYLNTNLKEFLGQAEDKAPDAAVPAPDAVPDTPAEVPETPAPAVEAEAEVAIKKGDKIKYSVGGKTYQGTISLVDMSKETVNAGMHKNIPLADLIELL